MGCSGSSSKAAPPPKEPCKLKVHNPSSFSDSVHLVNENSENVMLFKKGSVVGQHVEWQAASAWEAKHLVDNSLLMYIATETTFYEAGDKSKFKPWADELSGWKDVSGPPQFERPAHIEFQIELKSIIYSDATKSKELASVTVKAQGETWYDAQDVVTKFTAGLKYVLAVGGADEPVEVQVNGGQMQWKTSLFTSEWTASSFDTLYKDAAMVEKMRFVTIHKSGDEAALGAVLGAVVAIELNPHKLGTVKVEEAIIRQFQDRVE